MGLFKYKKMKKHLIIIGLLFISFFGFAQIDDKEDTEFTIYGFGRTNFVWDNRDIMDLLTCFWM